ncbi:MAG: ZIP family metal transporter [Firmicutes bacterium]|nr:ZIP family metal transporter [Bacillota bacterium]
MNGVLQVSLIGLLAGVIGTASGGIVVFFLKNPRKELLSFVLGFSGGIMLAIVFSDLIPEAIEAGNMVSAILGLCLGVILILILDLKLPHFHIFETDNEYACFLRTGVILGLGIAMHNLPEGIAIGAGYMASPALGFALAFTIALHNVPEGMAMAGPLCVGGMRIRQIFLFTGLAGLPMGIGAFIGAYVGLLSPLILSLALGFAGGAMLYIIFNELIPGSQSLSSGYAGTFGAVFGTMAGIIILSLL